MLSDRHPCLRSPITPSLGCKRSHQRMKRPGFRAHLALWAQTTPIRWCGINTGTKAEASGVSEMAMTAPPIAVGDSTNGTAQLAGIQLNNRHTGQPHSCERQERPVALAWSLAPGRTRGLGAGRAAAAGTAGLRRGPRGLLAGRSGRRRELQRSTAGPGRESIPELGDIPATDSERGEPSVLYLVQPPAGVREILDPQTGIQPLREANQLANGEALQGGSDIPIVSRDRSRGFSELRPEAGHPRARPGSRHPAGHRG